MRLISKAGLLALAVVACLEAWAQGNVFRDPLDTPARPVAQPTRVMLMDAVGTADGAWVAVGRRGTIITSKDRGASWQQAQVPVATDLLAVSFASASKGWAVGHAGVVLHTDDGGRRWQRQLDGRALAELLIQQYAPAAQSGDPRAQRDLEEAQRFKEDGPGRPLFDVLFTDAQQGFAVGAYNLALRTRDGGRTWQSFGDQLDNPMAMHLYAIAQINGVLWIAGEQGLLLRQEAVGTRFMRVKVPYAGTFFGVVGRGDEVVAFGLRGNAWRSADGGNRWTALETGTQSSITAGTFLGDGQLALATMGGELLLDAGKGAALTRLQPAPPMPWFGMVDFGQDGLLLTGARGVAVYGAAAGRNHPTDALTTKR